MKNILLICILLLSTKIFASIEYQKFVGKWQEESRTYGKKKKKQTETNAANSLIYEFTEEGIFKRFYDDGRIIPGNIRVKNKKISFFCQDVNSTQYVLEKKYSSFAINDQTFILYSEDTIIVLKKVENFTFKTIKKVTNNDKSGDVQINLSTMQGSWRRYKTEPTITTDKDSWSIFHLTVEYSLASNRYLGKAQFVSVNQGQHPCDVTIVPRPEKNEFIITEEDTEDVTPLGLKLKIKVLKCEGREMILKQGDMTYWYKKEYE
ncbi:MAG: hypothetical protein IPF62_02255 [Bacteroidetes bacterium]|nr:hypothetical protein [Bacteroidota bacterium]